MNIEQSIELQRIILDKYLYIGDRVVMSMDKEARSWGREGKPDGLAGTVVGFSRYTTYVDYTNNFGRRPGVYTCNGSPVILWDDGTSSTTGAMSLRWEGVSCEDAHNVVRDKRRENKVYMDAFDSYAFYSALPETSAWPLDLVKVRPEVFSPVCDPDGWTQVRRVNYSRLGEFCDDGVTPMSIYDICHPADSTGTMFCAEQDILGEVKRGNVWKWYNDKESLCFKDLREEASLHTLLGLTVEPKNPKTGNYNWSKDDVLEAIRLELVDGFSMGYVPFVLGGKRIRAFRFLDRQIGDRVRAETMKGFAVQP